jgi:hypothetical protein
LNQAVKPGSTRSKVASSRIINPKWAALHAYLVRQMVEQVPGRQDLIGDLREQNFQYFELVFRLKTEEFLVGSFVLIQGEQVCR